MSDVHAEASHLQVFMHHDDETPWEFAVELLRSVFKMPAAKAANFADTVGRYGQAVCGTYQRLAANKLVETASLRSSAADHDGGYHGGRRETYELQGLRNGCGRQSAFPERGHLQRL